MLFTIHRVLLKPRTGGYIGQYEFWKRLTMKEEWAKSYLQPLLLYKDQTQVTWPCGQKTSPEERPGLCVWSPCCTGHKCSAVHGGLRKELACSQGSRTSFATIYNLWPRVSHCVSLVFLNCHKGPGHGSYILWFLWKCQTTLSSQQCLYPELKPL